MTTPDVNQEPTIDQSPHQPNSRKKLLVIGGAGGAALLLVVVAAVIGFRFLGGGLPGPNSPLDLVPQDADAVFRMDLPAIADNPDFLENAHEFTGDWLIDMDLEAEEASIGNIEVDLAPVEEIYYLIADYEIILLRGDLQFEDLREDLEDANYEEEPYRGYEAWASPSGTSHCWKMTATSSIRPACPP